MSDGEKIAFDSLNEASARRRLAAKMRHSQGELVGQRKVQGAVNVVLTGRGAPDEIDALREIVSAMPNE